MECINDRPEMGVARRIRNRDKIEGGGNKRATSHRLLGESYQQRSLTGSRDLHNYVEVRGGRLIRPILQDGHPSQHFDAFINLLESEVANRILIVSFEINVRVRE